MKKNKCYNLENYTVANHTDKTRSTKMSGRDDIFKAFIKYGDETEDRVKNGIEKNRKGFAQITLKDKTGNQIVG